MDKDIVWKTYLTDDTRFADLVNGILFHGSQVVKATDIQEIDTQTGYIEGPGRKKQGNPKIRDTLRKVRFGRNYARIGIECEEFIDYSMSLRELNYNVGEYEKQAAKIRSQVKRQKKGLSIGERLYRFKKDSRLSLVETVILYCGAEEWDGPLTLYDIVDFTDLPDELRAYAQDYRAHIVEVRKMKDTSMFHTDVRQVLDFIRLSEDKAALKNLVESDPYYQNMEEDAWDVAAKYANVGELIKVKEYCRKDGKVDMSTAIKELMADERREGRKEGRKEGIAKGARRTQKRCIRNLMESMNLTEEEAAAALKITLNKKSKPASRQ